MAQQFNSDDVGTKVVYIYKYRDEHGRNQTEFWNATLKAITEDGSMVRLSFGFMDLEYLFGGGWHPTEEIKKVADLDPKKKKPLPYKEYLNE